MLHSITAQVDIRLGIIISVLSAIPVLTVIYVTESAKFAGFRQKWTDCARQLVRLAAFQSFRKIFRSRRARPADGENTAAVTATRGEARDAHRQA
jgi:hypothetical protein